MLEALLQFIGELLLSCLLEVLSDVGPDLIKAPFSRESHPVLAGLGWMLLGAIAGGLSLLGAPHNLLHGAWRIVNLVVTPLATAGLVHVFRRDAAPAQHGGARTMPWVDTAITLKRPAYAFVFALAVAVVRFSAAV
jgi:hypothetical protein